MVDEEREDKDLRRVMKQISDVPFRSELKQRILDEAKLPEGQPVRTGRARRRPSVGKYLVAATGLVAAVFIAVIGLQETGKQIIPHTSATKGVPFQIDAREFGLETAPVQISDVRVGTADGDPLNSDVLANVTNTSKAPLSESQVFGVLSFSPQGKPSSAENWLTFVNGPSKTIAPGQTVIWHFHPTGERLHVAGDTQIVEQPHLSFYSSHVVNPDAADIVWKRSPIDVGGNIQVVPRDLGNGLQSVQIDASLKNTSKHSIDLSQSRAVIWFASNSDQSFLSDNSIRFMYHLTPEYPDQSWPTILKPGQRVDVNFRVISDTKSDFFSRTPHVLIIDAGSLSS